MKSTVYWIEGSWPGRLAIIPRPRGGDWLEDEINAWKTAGIHVIVSMLHREESEELNILQEADLCKASGLEFVSFPIADRDVPPSAPSFSELVRHLENELETGKNIAVHCRQGVGRSAMLAASLLIGAGVDAASAWERIRVARGCSVPDTTEQKAWIERHGAEFLTVSQVGE